MTVTNCACCECPTHVHMPLLNHAQCPSFKGMHAFSVCHATVWAVDHVASVITTGTTRKLQWSILTGLSSGVGYGRRTLTACNPTRAGSSRNAEPYLARLLLSIVSKTGFVAVCTHSNQRATQEDAMNAVAMQSALTPRYASNSLTHKRERAVAARTVLVWHAY